MAEPAEEGFRAKQAPVPFDPYLDRYYELRQWDDNGIPTLDCLAKLDLLDYAETVGIEKL